ncbi:MAG TPA: glycosyltransferase family 4 protein [Thermoanaerobaculia bacterium]|nr:glycosyltransferase family 4 protein [Thermoanaerobaculia bacterium]
MLQARHRSLYAAFDRFPSRKGAAIHIDRFARALFDFAGGGLLYVLGGDDLPAQQFDDNIEIVRFSTSLDNFLERTVAFGERLEILLDEVQESLHLVHFRDPWSGVPIVSRRRDYAVVYEVNALPSIELPYTYPSAAPSTLTKIEKLEQIALDRADAIVTPSATIRDGLLRRGVDDAKITLIPNGADLPDRVDRPNDAPRDYILYFGALQEWQGIETLLRALARVRDLDLQLVICSSHDLRYAKGYVRLAERLEVADRIVWQTALTSEELQPWLQHAMASLAPLTDCARNVVQGCSPLKIVESMAAGVPVIASDLPAVRELITDRCEGLLVAPDRPAELARAIRILFEYPHLRGDLGSRGRERVRQSLTWAHATKRLVDVYSNLAFAEVTR